MCSFRRNVIRIQPQNEDRVVNIHKLLLCSFLLDLPSRLFISSVVFKSCDRERSTSGYFTVDPVLRLNSAETIPLDCVSLQTVLSKCLGPLSEWYDRLRVSIVIIYKVLLNVMCNLTLFIIREDQQLL